ncbi:phage tail protein [Providencia rettgeri]
MSKPTGKLIRVTPEGIGAVPTSSIVQTTGQSTTQVMSQSAVTQALLNAVNLDTIYPVGIVTWFAQNKNPNTLFPGTKWQYIGENKTIRLASSSGANVLQSGGSDSVTLAVGNMPAHGHTFSATTSNFDYGTKSTNNTGAHTHNISKYPRYESKNAPANGAYQMGIETESKSTDSGGNHAHTVAIGAHTHTVSGTTGNQGGGAAITVTNAYIMLMGWYRLS